MKAKPIKTQKAWGIFEEDGKLAMTARTRREARQHRIGGDRVRRIAVVDLGKG